MYITEWRQSGKATWCMISIMRHPGKSQTTETVKRSVVARGWGTHEYMDRGLSGQWKCPVWHYNEGYMSLYICPNPQNAQHQEWTYCKRRLWVVMMCQCRFVSCDQSPTLVVEAAHPSGQGARAFLYHLLDFEVNVKLL